MTTPGLPDGDAIDVHALIADRYLGDLLAGAERRADDAPADAALDPGLRHAARALRRSLVRVHPSFLFEERLAGRLAAVAAARPDAAAEPAGSLESLRATDPLLPAILAGGLDPAAESLLDEPWLLAGRRPLIVGGAITSAAISLVGVAWVAWRVSRPGAGNRIGGPA